MVGRVGWPFLGAQLVEASLAQDILLCYAMLCSVCHLHAAGLSLPACHPPHPPAVAALLVLFPGMFGLAALLCWAAVELSTAAWTQLRQQPELLGQEGALRQLLDAESSLDAATLAYVQHLLPPLPMLLLGLVLREGSELVSTSVIGQVGRCIVRSVACAFAA